ncbi:MAG: hypothetical protein ACTSRG_08025 [Candidatus Helarchaeota archaeon]
MRVNLESIRISLDLGTWVHKYLEDLKMYAARKDPQNPFPNLKIDTDENTVEDIHSVTDILLDQIKKGLPPEAVLSNLQKFKIGDYQAISIDISGRKYEGKDILIIMKIIATKSKLVNLSFTLIAETVPEYKDEFQKITESFQEL